MKGIRLAQRAIAYALTFCVIFSAIALPFNVYASDSQVNDGAYYRVEYWTEELDGGYELAKSYDRIGIDGGEVKLRTYVFKGYTSNNQHPDCVLSGTASTDEKLVLKLYYDLNEYTVSYAIEGTVPSGIVAPETETYNYGESVEVAESLYAEGYVFSGWTDKTPETDENYVDVSSGEFTVPAKNVILTGYFVKNPDTNYKVEHYLENLDGGWGDGKGGSSPAVTNELYVAAGEDVEVNYGEFTGFEANPEHPDTVLTGDTLKLYYERNTYPLRYRYTGTIPEGAPIIPNAKPELPYEGHKIQVPYGTEYTLATPPTLDGYTFDGWTAQSEGVEVVDNKLTMPAQEVIVVGGFGNGDTPYRIEHWNEQVDGSFVLEMEYERLGIDGSDIGLRPYIFTGYTSTLKHPDCVTKGTVSSVSTLVMKLYNYRDTYDVSYVIDGYIPDGVELPETVGYKYGKTVNVADELSADGYLFSGWSNKAPSTDENYVDVSSGEFTVPANDVVLTGSFVKIPDSNYKVEHYLENLDGSWGDGNGGSTPVMTEKLFAQTDVYVGNYACLTGFSAYPDHPDTVKSGADTLKLYYKRNTYSLRYRYIGTIPEGAPAIPNAKPELPYDGHKIKVPYGTEYELVAPFSLDGYYFDGWHSQSEGIEVVDNKLTMPAQEVIVVANLAKYRTIGYELNGGASSGTDYSPETAFDGSVITLKDAPIRSGYTFRAWSDGENEYKAGDSVTVIGDVTFKALWSVIVIGDIIPSFTNEYKLSYSTYGGTAYSDEKYKKGYTVELDKYPERDGYIFGGWYLDKNYTKAVTSVTLNKNVTVYALWSEAKAPSKLDSGNHYAYVLGYDDGTIRPHANITRAEAATIFFRLQKAEVRKNNLSSESSFADVRKDEWFNTYVATLEKLGVLTAREGNSFCPNEPITRAELAEICTHFDSTSYVEKNTFTDVSGHRFEKAILKATAYGWINGYEDNTFRPDEPITRAEAMAIINRMLKRIPKSIDDILTEKMNVWTDNVDISAWYYLHIQEATSSHSYVISEDGYESWTEIIEGFDWADYQ